MISEQQQRARTTGNDDVRRLRLVRTALCLAMIAGSARTDNPSAAEGPTFSVPITNVTVPVGREAVLACVVANLSNFKVAWLRVDTQTILTIANHVITKNHRIGVTHSEHKTWHLHIRDVRESDRGDYMCQINTDPMKSQIGYLEVVVPPDILDLSTSTDMVVREGGNVTLRCAATGSPTPNITWRREDGELILLGNGQGVASIEGSVFNITKVNRLQMGAYLCIASNGVPPTVSKRIMLIVHFTPMIWIQNQLVGAREGQQMTLECHSEAFPKSINYWTRQNNDIITHVSASNTDNQPKNAQIVHRACPRKKNVDHARPKFVSHIPPSSLVCLQQASNVEVNFLDREKYEPSFSDNAYKVHMKLTIHSVGMSDYGTYKCISKNSLGETDGSIKLYHIPTPTTEPRTTSTTPLPTVDRVEKIERSRQRIFPSLEPSSNEITDASLSTVIKSEENRFRANPSNVGYMESENNIGTVSRKSIDSKAGPRRIDNTPQSMSSKGTASDVLLRSRAIICIILLSALS